MGLLPLERNRSIQRAWAVGALCIALPLAGCTVGHKVTTVPAGQPVEGQAAYYALPRTVVVVDFPVQKKETKAGTGTGKGKSCYDRLGDPASFLETPASGKAPTLLDAIGLLKAPSLTKKTYAVTDPPTISSLPEPDPGRVYRVDLASNWAKKQTVDLTYGPLGVLEAGTSFVQDRRVDLAVASVKAVLSLVAASAEWVDTLNAVPQPLAKPLTCSYPLDEVCQKAACEIYRARRALVELPSRVSPAGLRADQAEWLEKRNQQTIAENLPVFFQSKTAKGSIRCAFRPPAKVAPAAILKFQKEDGFANGGGASDCAIPPEFACSSCKSFSTYTLGVTVPTGQYSEFLRSVEVDKQHDASQPQGFYYRVPAVASLELKHGKDRVVEKDVVVAQLGIVAALPAQRTYQTKYDVKLDPNTGALIKLTAESEAVAASTITDLGDSVSGYLEKREEAKEAEAAAQDELALLERERKLLEERKKIRDLLEELGEEGEP